MFFRAAREGLVLTVAFPSGEVVRVIVAKNRKRRGGKDRPRPLRLGIEADATARIEVVQFSPRGLPLEVSPVQA